MLLREHGDAIEADLAYRGIDLLDLWRGTLSPRRVCVLIKGLPPDSATQRELRGSAWTQTDYILADVYDAIQQGTVVAMAAASGKKPQEATPYPRPGTKAKSRITASALLAFRERTRS